MSCYIYQLPSWVVDDLCRNMDTLSEWDWMHFGEWPRQRSRRSPSSKPPPRLFKRVLIRGVLCAARLDPGLAVCPRAGRCPLWTPVRSVIGKVVRDL